MNALRSGAAVAWLALLVAPSCSRGPDSAAAGGSGVPGGSPWVGAAGPMFVEECSLGCGSGRGGVPLSCDEVGIHVNEEVAVRFSRHVDLTTVTPSSFALRRVDDGLPVTGLFSLRPGDARTLSFQPALSFDPQGNPIFALEPNEAYELFSPGTGSNDPPPYVRSIEGRANESRIDCLLVTTEGVMDYVPGHPVVQVLVDRIDPSTGERIPDQPTVTAQVAVDTAFDFVFEDVMNLATVVNPTTGEAPFLKVEIDADDNLMTTADRLPVAGAWEVSYTLTPPRTVATFTPDELLPGGGQPVQLRRIVVSLPPQVVDLVGNPLAGSGLTWCRTVLIPVVESTLVETFDDSSNEEVEASGATWGAGALTYGHGGGSGRLGRLAVGFDESSLLDTDTLTFPLDGAPEDVLTNEVPVADYVPSDRSAWPEVTVTDGNFEFGALSVEAGGVLAAEGRNAARLFSRGDLVLDGVLDVAGESAAAHQGNSGNDTQGEGQLTALGGEGGRGGPNGSDGGAGGDRFNHGDNAEDGCPITPMLNAGGIVFDPDPPMNPGSDNDGRAGVGVGGTRIGAGQGGLHWPPSPPRTLATTIPGPCRGDSEWVIVQDPDETLRCRIAMVAGAGSGGGYALPGMDGIAFSPYSSLPSTPGVLPLTPGPTPGGDTTGLALGAASSFPEGLRDLDWHAGELRGGASGGGGGMSLFGTTKNSTPPPGADCYESGSIFPYWDHSGAGGGGAGGATQLVSGRTLSLAGMIDAAGGDGGSSLDPTAEITQCTNTGGGSLSVTCTDFAAPGGAGSGGAVKLQGVALSIANQPARLSVAGGTGGAGAGGSVGGDGGPGLVRLEQVGGGLDPHQLAPRLEPYLPGDIEFNMPYPSATILSLGDWEAPEQRPDSYSASTSCWMRPDGPYFALDFVPDDASMPLDPDAYGWNMDVLYETANGIKAFPYQGISNDPDFPLGNVSFAEFLGNQLNHDLPAGEGSLFCVRFQAARSVGALSDPCEVDLADPAQVVPGSVTPWVLHSRQLHWFFLMPNMVRFTVAFDRSLVNQNAITQNIRGVTNLRIGVLAN